MLCDCIPSRIAKADCFKNGPKTIGVRTSYCDVMITIILGWATLELDKQPGTLLANSACFCDLLPFPPVKFCWKAEGLWH